MDFSRKEPDLAGGTAPYPRSVLSHELSTIGQRFNLSDADYEFVLGTGYVPNPGGKGSGSPYDFVSYPDAYGKFLLGIHEGATAEDIRSF